jgi:Tol biopolymer transport system component/C-terminal processing protease CtpA/Prc
MKQFVLLFLSMIFLAPLSYAQDEALWMRYSSISPDGNTIVFSYKGDLFKVATSGGKAVALTSHEGYEFMPVWSHDGQQIAFASDRNGNFDIYTIPISGGQATRITSFSRNEYPWSFSPDNKNILFTSVIMDQASNLMFPRGNLSELYSVPASGGRISQILSSSADMASYTADGSKVLYQDVKGLENTWRKHHTSSVTKDIWTYDVKANKHTRLTTFKGEDRNPVFSKDESEVFYLSEESGTLNIHKLSTGTPNQNTQLTKFKTHPVRFLTIADDNTLCFGYNGEIYTKKGDAEPVKVSITVGVDGLDNDIEFLKMSSGATEMNVSPNGKEIAFIARGEVFVTSVDYGTTKQITKTPEQERSVSFSPDGKAVLYASERNNSWNLYQTKLVKDTETSFANATLLKEEVVFEAEEESFQPAFSPDGKEVAFLSERVVLKVITLSNKNVRTVFENAITYSYSDGDQWYEWSPDGKWFLMHYADSHLFRSNVALVDATGNGKFTNLTQSGYDDYTPRWAMGGKAMIWFSDKQGMRNHGSWGSTSDVYGMFFTQDTFDDFNLTKEEYELRKEAEKKDKDEDKKDNDKDEDAIEPITIDLTNIEDRQKRLTIHSSNLSSAIMTKDGSKLYYMCQFDDGYDLWVHDFRKKETKQIADLGGRGGDLQFDKDEKNLFLFSNGSIVKIATADNKRKGISFSAEMYLDKTKERAYMFEHIWRQVQKKFYVTNLHNVDWKLHKEAYATFLPHINNNYDYAEMLSEMLGELNASHTGSGYRHRDPAGDATASLGVFFDYDYTGTGVKVVEVLAKSPLTKAKSEVEAGTIIEKIDGVEITANMSHFALLNHKSGKNTLLSCYNPTTKKRWDEVVKPISLGQEYQLLYKRWVERQRAETERISKGRLGYVHIRGMNSQSFRDIFSDIFGKNAHKEALIVDTRFNGGGWLHDDLATLLSGEKYVTYIPREKEKGWDPMNKWIRPSILLMNEGNYSDAHAFPYVYSTLEIGETVGMPVPGTMTAVWWETLLDRSLYFGIPQVGAKDMEGKYLENQQLEPDYKVWNDYDLINKGQDQQLEKAIDVMLKQLDK